MNSISWFFVAVLIAAAFMLAATGCSTTKPYYPDFYSAGESIQAACADVIFEHSPPTCAELGWCAQYGYVLEMNAKDGELCVGH